MWCAKIQVNRSSLAPDNVCHKQEKWARCIEKSIIRRASEGSFSIGRTSVCQKIRSSLDNRIARTLFAVEGGRMVLLHGFIK